MHLYENPANRLLNPGLTFVLVFNKKEDPCNGEKEDKQ
jgi:hypothetical protein